MPRIGIQTIESSIDLDWSAGTGTLVDISTALVKADGFEIAEPEEFTTETADGLEQFDGARWRGVLPVEEGSTVPADNTPFWLVVTPLSGTARIYGGTLGCIGHIIERGLQSIVNGRLYSMFKYVFVSATGTGGMRDTP